MRNFLPSTIAEIRALEGQFGAQAVGELYDVSAETIRRIWRRETYRKAGPGAGAGPARPGPEPSALPPPDDILASLGRITTAVNTQPEEPHDDPAHEA